MNRKKLNQIEGALNAVRLKVYSPRMQRAGFFTFLGFIGAHALSMGLILVGGDNPHPDLFAFFVSAASAVYGFKSSRFSSNLERLYVLLSDVQPTDVNEFKRVQEAAKVDWDSFCEALRVWIDLEKSRLEPPKSSAASAIAAAQQAFVSKSF